MSAPVASPPMAAPPSNDTINVKTTFYCLTCASELPLSVQVLHTSVGTTCGLCSARIHLDALWEHLQGHSANAGHGIVAVDPDVLDPAADAAHWKGHGEEDELVLSKWFYCITCAGEFPVEEQGEHLGGGTDVCEVCGRRMHVEWMEGHMAWHGEQGEEEEANEEKQQEEEEEDNEKQEEEEKEEEKELDPWSHNPRMLYCMRCHTRALASERSQHINCSPAANISVPATFSAPAPAPPPPSSYPRGSPILHCAICNIDFPRKDLELHRPWICTICKRLHHEVDAASHFASHTTQASMPTSAPTPTPTQPQPQQQQQPQPQPKNIFCAACNATFRASRSAVHESWTCTVCNMTMHQSGSAIHKRGKKHLRLSTPSAPIAPPPQPPTHAPTTTTVTTTPQQTTPFVFRPFFFFCPSCNANFPSTKSALHECWTCTVCELTMHSAVADFHCRGEYHHARLSASAASFDAPCPVSEPAPAPAPAEVEVEVPVTANKQVRMFREKEKCEVCGMKLNIEREIHEMGQRHVAAVARLVGAGGDGGGGGATAAMLAMQKKVEKLGGGVGKGKGKQTGNDVFIAMPRQLRLVQLSNRDPRPLKIPAVEQETPPSPTPTHSAPSTGGVSLLPIPPSALLCRTCHTLYTTPSDPYHQQPPWTCTLCAATMHTTDKAAHRNSTRHLLAERRAHMAALETDGVFWCAVCRRAVKLAVKKWHVGAPWTCACGVTVHVEWVGAHLDAEGHGEVEVLGLGRGRRRASG